VLIATAPVVLVVTLPMDYMRIKPASRVHQIALLATRVNVRNVMPIIKLMQLVFVYLVAPLIRSWLSVLENVFLAQIFFPLCRQCNATYCYSCLSGSTRNNSQCLACATNCTTCDVNGPGSCDYQCPLGETAWGPVDCRPCANNCQICDFSGYGNCDDYCFGQNCGDGYCTSLPGGFECCNTTSPCTTSSATSSSVTSTNGSKTSTSGSKTGTSGSKTSAVTTEKSMGIRVLIANILLIGFVLLLNLT